MAKRQTELDIRREWFFQGHAAFAGAFPSLTRAIPISPFYVCPLCQHAFPESAIERRLTRDDVPPASVGGRKMVLTCRRCNSTAGHTLDHHARKEADVIGFGLGSVNSLKASLRTGSEKVPIRLTANDRELLMKMGKKFTSKEKNDAAREEFEAGITSGGSDYRLHIDFQAFSPRHARVSWLRAAYLAFFAVLGYSFVLRPDLDIVRAVIDDPKLESPKVFRVQRKELWEPTLVRVEEPEMFRSYLMLYGHNAIFLPRLGDSVLYDRLATLTDEAAFEFHGLRYPWPRRPMFLHDADVARGRIGLEQI